MANHSLYLSCYYILILDVYWHYDWLATSKNGVGKLWHTHNQVNSVYLEIQPPFSTEKRNIKHMGVCTVVESPLYTPLYWKVRKTNIIYVSVDTQILLTTHACC